MLAYFKSFQKNTIGETLAIAKLNPFVVLFLGFIFLGEVLQLYQIFIMIFVAFGLILLVVDKVKLSKYIYLPFITMLGWGYYSFVIDVLQKEGMAILNIICHLEISVLISNV